MKFFNLLKKELGELINAQMIITLVIYLVMIITLGQVMNATVEDAVKQEYTINISDRDNTDFTYALLDSLRKSGAEINEYSTSGDDYSAILEASGKKSLVIIPEGFTEKIENGESPDIISIAGMESASLTSNTTNSNSGAINLISACISNTFAEKAGLSIEDIEIINSPVSVLEHTVVKDKSAEASAEVLAGNLMTQSMILPIVVFLLIMTTSQMLMSAISNEKIDKTLETLLSAPVSRTSIIGAKMLASAIVALLNAAVMMIGFSFFMSGATSTIETEMSGTLATQYISIDEAMEKLGLTIGAGDYVLIGIQFFMTIMICLSISIMLGALVNDTKQSQTMIMPLMIAAIIPYMVSMIADINTLPMVYKIIVYAIPFTHTFSSVSNIMFGHMGIFWGGLAYQTVFFIVCMFFALRLFKSDKILTASLNFGQKAKLKSNKNNN